MLRFALPAAFWALSALPVLVCIYLWVGRARRVVVSSLFLWQAETPVTVGGRRLQKLQTPLLFFLELLVLLLLITAAAGPLWRTADVRVPVVVVLDDSYSMNAGSPSAREAVPAALDAALDPRRYGPVRVVRAGLEPEVLVPGPGGDWAARLADWHCRAPGMDLGAALTLARALGGPEALLWVLTDQAPDTPATGGTLRVQALGAPVPNAAVINAARTGGPDGDRCLVEVAAYAAEPLQTTLHVGAVAHPLTLAPGEVYRMVWDLPPETDVLEVRLDDDALAWDNTAWLPPERPRPVAVAVDLPPGPTRDLITQALAVLPTRLTDADEAALLVTDKTVPAGEARWTLQVEAVGDAPLLGGPFVMDGTHPLCAGMDLGGTVWGAPATPLPDGFQPLIYAGNTPLLGVREGAGQALLLRFSPARATWQRSPNWPIFFYNLIRARADHLPGLPRTAYRQGEAVLLRTGYAPTVTLTSADGEDVHVTPVRGTAVLPPGPPGMVHYRAGTLTGRFARNVLYPDESDTRRRTTGTWGDWTENPREQQAWRPLASWLIVAALLLLVLHRRLMLQGAEVGA